MRWTWPIHGTAALSVVRPGRDKRALIRHTSTAQRFAAAAAKYASHTRSDRCTARRTRCTKHIDNPHSKAPCLPSPLFISPYATFPMYLESTLTRAGPSSSEYEFSGNLSPSRLFPYARSSIEANRTSTLLWFISFRILARCLSNSFKTTSPATRFSDKCEAIAASLEPFQWSALGLSRSSIIALATSSASRYLQTARLRTAYSKDSAASDARLKRLAADISLKHKPSTAELSIACISRFLSS
mmetsp:Transcript_3907/g.16729  ORF Transcript_3907/g.16729 Transcript_3907/m.16729 type:complete len:243 (-) Transcript_3907:2340-3068(-)